jgi:hypothetical protein
MDWQFKVGISLAVVFGLLPYAVKDMPRWLSWPGVMLGILFVAWWGLIPSHDKIPLGPAFLFLIGISLATAALGWYRDGLVVTSSASGTGGAGGSGKIASGGGVIFGGRGGKGGSPAGGSGGAGGSGSITGGNGIIIGGDGGDAGYIDGEGKPHGGAGGRSPLERLKELGLSSPGLEMAETIAKLRQEYILSHDNVSPAMVAGTDPVPDDWMNQRLKEMEIPLHYEGAVGHYSLTRIPKPRG